MKDAVLLGDAFTDPAGMFGFKCDQFAFADLQGYAGCNRGDLLGVVLGYLHSWRLFM